jgi:hypothetical protein
VEAGNNREFFQVRREIPRYINGIAEIIGPQTGNFCADNRELISPNRELTEIAPERPKTVVTTAAAGRSWQFRNEKIQKGRQPLPADVGIREDCGKKAVGPQKGLGLALEIDLGVFVELLRICRDASGWSGFYLFGMYSTAAPRADRQIS